MKENGPNKKGLSRRSFLGGAVAGLAASQIPKIFQANYEGVERKVYKQGDTIPNPISPIRIEGWGLLLETKKVDEYETEAETNKESASFTVMSHGMIDSQMQVLFGVGGDLAEYQRTIGGRRLERLNTENKSGEATVYQRILVLPEENKPTLVNFEIKRSTDTDTDEIKDNKTYYVQPNFQSIECSSKSSCKMYIEKNQDNQSEVRELTDVVETFAPLMNDPTTMGTRRPDLKVYVFHQYSDATSPDPVYYPRDNRIVMSDKEIINQTYPHQASSALSHEFTHALINHRKNRVNLYEESLDIDGAFESIDGYVSTDHNWKSAFEGIKGGERTARISHPLFKLFKESSYQPDPLGGHPYDNSSEFMASAMSVIRYYSTKFIENYNLLSKDEQEVARNAVWYILKFIETLSRESKDPNLKYKFIPNSYDLVTLEKMAEEIDKQMEKDVEKAMKNTKK